MNSIEYIKVETDHCVKCGLCLPHCPTYVKTRDEGDSPRGRISLMQGLAQNQLVLTERLEYHLDRCLTCRACENVCPSQVHYGQLIDAARAQIRQQHPPAVTQRSINKLLIDPLLSYRSVLRLGAQLLRFYQKSGLRWLIRSSGILKPFTGLRRMENLLPNIPRQTPWQDFYPPYGNEKGNVALFTGCIGSVFDREAIDAGIELLRRCGYGVTIPRDQTCCGALHQHSGITATANQLAADNVAAFNGLNVDTVLFTSSGCGVTLNEYPLLEIKEEFNVPVMEITGFLNSVEWPAHLAFSPYEHHVVVHDPCSLRHVLHQHQEPYSLLRRIPGLTLSQLPHNDRCCGAAGSYMLTQAAMADSLRDDKLDHLPDATPTCLVTSNIGCALHLMAGCSDKHLDVEVMHPVTLLARQLETSKINQDEG